jgi:hypothetical protein
MATITYRGELRCFACGRYLGEFESHPALHGAKDLHLLPSEAGPQAHRPLLTKQGLRCSACNGRVVAEQVDRIAA